nr:putative metalloprotease CJM1_0395 family protein [Gilvimarinus xylanilyticus]
MEEGAAGARGENRRSPDDRPGEVEERERTRGEDRAPGAVSGKNAEAAEQKQQELEREQVRELAARDREVRAHERAHAAVGGVHAGAPTYEYTRGPDGINYATSGEVNVDTSPVPGDPQATLEKAQQIRRAAMAPAEPSGQDRQVAAQAAQLEAQARVEIAEQAREERRAEQAESEQSRERRQAENSPDESTQPVRAESGDSDKDDERERLAEAARVTADIVNRNIDINRQLIDIGVVEPPINSGALLDQRA